jgi:drug/metabolite transporter (DMT)-like permease
LLGGAALVFGEHIVRATSAVALGAFAYQTVWVVSITFTIWFLLIVRYSAARLSVFTFLTPLFGVAAGHVVLNEPPTAAFALAVALVAGGSFSSTRPGDAICISRSGSAPPAGGRCARCNPMIYLGTCQWWNFPARPKGIAPSG